MEDAAGAEADIETHFNMGVAFKEMQLYDEAIGEFQKAFGAAQQAKSYGNYVRCCTLLAHCFMEKNLPPLAVRWLETALKAPGLENEDLLALRYEVGTAHEMAGNKKAALDSFMEVYALNIDYRDVAERIRDLQGAVEIDGPQKRLPAASAFRLEPGSNVLACGGESFLSASSCSALNWDCCSWSCLGPSCGNATSLPPCFPACVTCC